MTDQNNSDENLNDLPEESAPLTSSGVDPKQLAEEAAQRRKELPLLQRIVKHFSKDLSLIHI